MVDSVRVFDPGYRVTTTAGAPVSGAKVKFYNAGGLVQRTVYSDSGLSVSLGATVTCDSGGVPAASAGLGADVLIYTGTTAYKVIITDSSDNTLFEYDNILGALDTSVFEANTALPRTPVLIKATNYSIVDADRASVINADPTGGTVTLTLPSAVTVGDNWRITVRHNGTANSVALATVSAQTINGSSSYTLLYQFESITLVSDGANWHISEDAFLRYPAGVFTPQGYLTVVPAATDPVNMIAITDQAAKTSVYYRPFKGNLVPLYNGLRTVPYEFTELTLTLSASHLASSFYDVFAFLDGTTLRIGTGPAWTTLTAGAGARGTGAATTQLTRVNGTLVNAVALTAARNGASTYAVSANRATYLGSLFMDASNGQISCLPEYGQSRKWGVWNAYNRLPVMLKMGDATASWTYNATTVQQSRATAGNTVAVFSGLIEDDVAIDFRQAVVTAASANNYARIGIGVNVTNAVSGFSGKTAGVAAGATGGVAIAQHILPPTIGLNNLNALEYLDAGATNNTYFGTVTGMLFTARFTA